MTAEMAADAAKRIHPDILYIYHYDASRISELLSLLAGEDMEIRIGKSVHQESTERQEQVPNVLHTDQSVDISIYPNPVKDYIIIENSKTISNVSIYNLNGQLIKNIILVGVGKQFIVTDFLKTGTYVLEIESGNQSLFKEQFHKE